MNSPHISQLITLSEEEARNTIHEVAERQPRCPRSPPPPPAVTSPAAAADVTAASFVDPKLAQAPSNISSTGGSGGGGGGVATHDDVSSYDVIKRPGRRAFPEYVKKLVAAKFRPFKV